MALAQSLPRPAAAASTKPLLPPLCRQVQQRYDGMLREERSSRDARVAALEAEAREAASTASLEVARVREQGEKSVRTALEVAQKRVQELEEERIRLQQDHRLTLKAMESAIQKNRDEGDERIRQAEEETLACHSHGDAEVARITAEREAALRATRERCAAAEQAGDAAARFAEEHDQQLMAETRKAIAGEEASRRQAVAKADKSMEIWLKHFEHANTEVLRRVSEKILHLLQEVKTSREILAENRSRADGSLEHHLETSRAETQDKYVKAKGELDSARDRLNRAQEESAVFKQEVGRACLHLDRERRLELTSCADAVEIKLRSLGLKKAADMPGYVHELEELARQLRTGKFRAEPPPRLEHLAAR